MLKPNEVKFLRELRIRGYAVVVFTPDELEGASQDQVEERMIESGWDVIQLLKDPDYEPEE